MVETYKVVLNEERVRNFINLLPDLDVNEKYYLSLFARKKYVPELIKSNDKTQLKRFLSTKERMFDKIKQLEIPLGHYKLRDMVVPQESLVLYIMPNPRSMIKATKLMLRKTTDLILNEDRQGYNIVAESLSAVQKSKSRTWVVDFDIDEKPVDFNKLSGLVPKTYRGKPTYSWLETRGGYHLMVYPEIMKLAIRHQNNQGLKAKFSENWYKTITTTYTVDQSSDQMLPFPGTYQGGFEPRLI